MCEAKLCEERSSGRKSEEFEGAKSRRKRSSDNPVDRHPPLPPP